MNKRLKRRTGWILEILEWTLIIWLLLPLSQALERPIYFPRILLGILLFVIFTGKMFYDAVIKPPKENKTKDLLSLLGAVVIMAVIVLAAVGFIGVLIWQLMSQNVQTP